MSTPDPVVAAAPPAPIVLTPGVPQLVQVKIGQVTVQFSLTIGTMASVTFTADSVTVTADSTIPV